MKTCSRISQQAVCLCFVCGMVLLAASRGWSEDLRILCWEGYAAPEYTQKFEQMIKAKHGIDLKVVGQNVSDPGEFFEAVRLRKAVCSPLPITSRNQPAGS